MENVFRLHDGSKSLSSFIPAPKSGRFSGQAQIQREKNNSKVTKTEENKLRLILQYGNGDSCDFDEKERKINGNRAKITPRTRIPVHNSSMEHQRKSLHRRFDFNKVTITLSLFLYLSMTS